MNTDSILYADIVLPLYLDKAYSYIISDEFKNTAQVGKRVLVQFGRSKYYTGIITKIHTNAPSYPNIKQIEEVIDEEPILHENNIQLWEWMAEYYMCGIGEVMDNAIPAVYKLSSERNYAINSALDYTSYDLSSEEYILAEAISSRNQLTLDEIKKVLGKSKIIKELNTLIQLGIIYPIENISEKYTPKYEKYIKISSQYVVNKDLLNDLFQSLQTKSPNQWKLLLNYFSMSPKGEDVVKSDLILKSDSKSNFVKALVDKSIFIETTKIIDRFQLNATVVTKEVSLSTKQLEVYNEIEQHFESKNTVLLRGVTGSGKTEIYIKWLKEHIKQDKTCLLILPEIALTSQIVHRLNEYFGSNFAVYHSQINQNNKFELWRKIYTGEIRFVVGTRSAIFLPFKQLDAIVIDEEHDFSLKQSDLNPRFHARDSLQYYATLFQSKLLLCSATPSSDSYFNVKQGRYAYVELNQRFHSASLPKIEFINLKEKEKSSQLKSHYSDTLLKSIEQTLAEQKQVILFHNRRGYSPYVQCNTCDYIEKCDQCDVRLTYHSSHNVLICHYCYKKYSLKVQCKNCHNNTLKTRGLGTQKVEEEIQLFFPNALIKRLDIDTVRSTQRLETILEDFQNKKIDILIGTQMVSKGLDFEHLNMVGIINADTLFAFTDYKTNEKAFQTLYQVSGRVGRRNETGHVYIQTYDPKYSVFQYLENENWQGFIDRELELRKEFIYPPYCRMIKISVRHLKEDLLNIYTNKIGKKIREEIQCVVLGPATPQISRIRNQYIRDIIIKLPKDKHLSSNKKRIKEIIDNELFLLSNKNFRIDIIVDI